MYINFGPSWILKLFKNYHKLGTVCTMTKLENFLESFNSIRPAIRKISVSQKQINWNCSILTENEKIIINKEIYSMYEILLREWFIHHWSPRGEEKEKKSRSLFFFKWLRTSQIWGEISILNFMNLIGHPNISIQKVFSQTY